MINPVKLSILSFKKSSFIMIENKLETSHFYIIKSGNVKLSKEIKTFPNETDHILKEGDFFGVTSCMSRHPREETAQAITDTSIIEIDKNEFGPLIRSNPEIGLKIIRSFSARLRHMDNMMTKVHGEDEYISKNFSTNLLNMARFYYQNKEYKQAFYVYQQLKENYADDITEINEVNQRLNDLIEFKIQTQADKSTNTVIYKEGSIIFCEYEIGKNIFLIQKGQVKISRIINNNEKILAILKPGEIFGEMSILENKCRNATASALGKVQLLTINQANFDAIIRKEEQLAIKLITMFSERLWIGLRQLKNNALKSPVIKLLDALLLETERARIEIQRAAHHFNFGPKELLELVGVNQEDGRIPFAQLLKMKIISISKDGKKIYCPNLEELYKEHQIMKNKEMRNNIIEMKKKKKEEIITMNNKKKQIKEQLTKKLKLDAANTKDQDKKSETSKSTNPQTAKKR